MLSRGKKGRASVGGGLAIGIALGVAFLRVQLSAEENRPRIR